MSLSCKWPAFDHVVKNGVYYLRIKSDQFVRCKTDQDLQDILIVPTDDDRIKILTIPLAHLQKGTDLTLAEKV